MPLKKLFYQQGSPLSSFSAKTRMAEAMRIIGPTSRADLNIIRAIRSHFAHTYG